MKHKIQKVELFVYIIKYTKEGTYMGKKLIKEFGEKEM